MTFHSFAISDTDSGTRIDLYLTAQYPEESRSAIQKWCDQNLVLLNGHSTKASYKLRAGDKIDVVVESSAHSADPVLEPWAFPLDILYEDSSLLAINKPAHVVVHPGAGVSKHTIAHAVIHRDPEIRSVGHPLRPGIVHRLDKETSGVLMLAKTQQAYLQLTAMFKNREIQKHYRAVVFGKMQSNQGKISKALGRDPLNRQKISVRAKKSRDAITLYKVLNEYDFGALLDVEILTGRTHQIRVHLSSENHPIVGDSKYGGGNWNRIHDFSLRIKLKQSGFFGLHAFSLQFRHPVTGEPLTIQAPIPDNWDF